MKTAIEDVTKFHETYGVPILDSPEIPSWERRTLRWEIIYEEMEELRHAMAVGLNRMIKADLIEVADGIADAIYVLIGTALEFGIPLEKVWDEVQRSNMSKLDENGKPILREDGKVLKGPNFFKPDIAKIINEKTGKISSGQNPV